MRSRGFGFVIGFVWGQWRILKQRGPDMPLIPPPHNVVRQDECHGLAGTTEPAKDVLGVQRVAVVADHGYFKIEDIEACENAGMVPYVPRPQRGPSVKAGLFRKDEFQYDATSDSYDCPAGQRLHPYSSSLLRGLKKIN